MKLRKHRKIRQDTARHFICKWSFRSGNLYANNLRAICHTGKGWQIAKESLRSYARK